MAPEAAEKLQGGQCQAFTSALSLWASPLLSVSGSLSALTVPGLQVASHLLERAWVPDDVTNGH